MIETRLFDLNIEEVLDHWETEHAIREVIANALDEQLLTDTDDVQIYEDAGTWHMRDFGRGLAIEHFTLNENEEKLAGPSGIIGKFGVGLKDALATFHRRGVAVTIRSRHGVFRLREAHKHNFDAITTLHVEHAAGDPQMHGTDFELRGVSRADVEAAKSLFLRFTSDETIENTQYGDVLVRGSDSARVYISGVFANDEPNFLFSYNITSLTPAMKKRLNRERLNVGRTTYAERVKSILKTAESAAVCEALADQVAARAAGMQCEEMQWIEIAHRALNLLHERREVAYVTEEELSYHTDLVDNMRRDGLQVVVVTEAQKAKLDDQISTEDTDLRTLEGYVQQYNDTFSYDFVDPRDLLPAEREVFAQSRDILELIGIKLGDAPPIRISETIRVTFDGTCGVWDAELHAIVIKRSQLGSPRGYAGTLLHETAHALTGAADVTRYFESVLTDYLGMAAARALGKRVEPVEHESSTAQRAR